jgi:hypothetical protein
VTAVTIFFAVDRYLVRRDGGRRIMIDIKNEMEHLVIREVGRRKGERVRGQDRCWCPRCEADITALALNNLPSRYCRGANFGYAASEGYGGQVGAMVDLAVEKVNRRPNHRPGAPDRHRKEAYRENYALKIGGALVDSMFPALEGVCSCDECRADALALALNRYRPKYGVSTPGRTSYQENFEDFIRHEVGLLLAAACQVVCANPNH